MTFTDTSGLSRDEQFALAELYKHSGITKERFCQERGINKNQLDYWLKKMREHKTDRTIAGIGNKQSAASVAVKAKDVGIDARCAKDPDGNACSAAETPRWVEVPYAPKCKPVTPSPSLGNVVAPAASCCTLTIRFAGAEIVLKA